MWKMIKYIKHSPPRLVRKITMSTLAKLQHNTMKRHTQSKRIMGVNYNEYVPKVYDSVLDIVGNTPLIRLGKIPAEHGVLCEIVAKCEFLNPSGSNKDRIGKSMVTDAINRHEVHDNTTFVEPSSGNTGIAIALNATLFEKGCIIVTKDKNSAEKVNTIKLLGSDVIQIKDNMDEEETAKKVIALDPKNRMMLSQFDNPVNPETHYKTTGLEITSAMKNKIDMLVMGAGTGGTISGVSRRVKEDCTNCLVILAEPDGSTMATNKAKYHPFLIEGIGGNYAPKNLDQHSYVSYEVVTDEEAFLMAREMAVKEGLLCGGSSGAIMVAAIKAAKQYKLGPDQRIVVILPDGIRNYMDKFVCDQWMEAFLFLDPPHQTMKFFVGAVFKDSLRNYATNPTKFPFLQSESMDFNSPVVDHLVKHCFTLSLKGKKGVPTIGRLSRILDITPFVVIGNECKHGSTTNFSPVAVITGEDVLDYIFAGSLKGPW